MSDILYAISAFILAITILVAVHEYGHYLCARFFNVNVLNFSIGFGPKLLRKKNKNDTEFSISLIPLGGYIKMLDEREADVPIDKLKYAFNRKPAWQKICIVAAGPVANFILAIIVFYFMYLIGIEIERPVIQHITPNSLAQKAGMKEKEEIVQIDELKVSSIEGVQLALAARLGTTGPLSVTTKDFVEEGNKSKKESDLKNYQINIAAASQWQVNVNKEPVSNALGIGLFPNEDTLVEIKILSPPKDANLKDLAVGDKLISYNNKKLTNLSDFIDYVKANPNKELELLVLHKDLKKNLQIKIGTHPETKKGFLGVAFKYPFYLQKQSYGWLDSMRQSVNRTYYYITQTFYMIYKLTVGHVGLDTVRGPVMVAKTAAIEIQLGIADFLSFLGVISIGLGVVNILPIPVLDGGHVVYHLYEWITGKQPTMFAEKMGVVVGIICLALIMSVAFYNDIIYW